jgi:hypothetical protein
LVLLVNSFQPLFVFMLGIVLTLFFPRVAKESLGEVKMLQKGRWNWPPARRWLLDQQIRSDGAIAGLSSTRECRPGRRPHAAAAPHAVEHLLDGGAATRRSLAAAGA